MAAMGRGWCEGEEGEGEWLAGGAQDRRWTEGGGGRDGTKMASGEEVRTGGGVEMVVWTAGSCRGEELVGWTTDGGEGEVGTTG